MRDRTNHRRRLFARWHGSNQGGDISSPTEASTAATPANSSNTIFRKASHKPRDKTTSEEDKQLDPDGKGEKSSLWNAAVIGIVFFLSWGELWAMGGSLLVLRVFLSVCAFLSALFIVLLYQVITFQRARKP